MPPYAKIIAKSAYSMKNGIYLRLLKNIINLVASLILCINVFHHVHAHT